MHTCTYILCDLILDSYPEPLLHLFPERLDLPQLDEVHQVLYDSLLKLLYT